MPNRSQVWVKPLTFALLALPFFVFVYAAAANRLGPDPAEYLAHETGEWALRILLLTLVATPLAHWFKLSWPMRVRRMLGLFAFFYAMLHAFSYIWLYAGFEFSIVLEDLRKRPYIVAGFVALLLMLPLAATSTRAMQRRLGRSWKRLHRLVYLTAVVALVHLLWQSRSDLAEAVFYSSVFGVLMLLRVDAIRKRFKLTAKANAAAAVTSKAKSVVN